jgi:flagellar M-ring protein FliF
MELFNEISKKAKVFWQSKDRKQKTKVAATAIICIILVFVIAFFLSRPTYVPLYSNLELKDAAAIVKKLEDLKIPHKLEDEGRTILVEPQHKYKTRLSLAQEGLPKGGHMGFSEVFDKNRLGTTDWERQIQFNQALQGELTRTIEEMAKVESARVHIVQPEKSLFIEHGTSSEAQAAIFLKLKQGEEFTRGELKGIVNLVSHSVKDLKQENVTVIDEYGRLLSDYSISEEGISEESINSRLTVQNIFQKQLQSGVQSLLEQVFGPGNVAVRVNAQLNFDMKTVESKLFSPVNEETGEGILRSIQELREHFSGAGTSPLGNPGTDTNIPDYSQQAGSGEDSDYERTETLRNFEMNEAHESLVIAPGAVDRLTVSVVINRELTQNEKQSITEMVGNAIGYDQERDQISIEGMSFKTDLADTIAQDLMEQQRRKTRQRITTFAVIGALLILIIYIYRTLSTKKKERIQEERTAAELIAAQQAAAAKLEEGSENDIYNIIEKYARRNPEDVAKVLKSWLNED